MARATGVNCLAAYQGPDLDIAPAMRKLFCLLTAEDYRYKSGQVAAPKALTRSDPDMYAGHRRALYISISVCSVNQLAMLLRAPPRAGELKMRTSSIKYCAEDERQ